MYAGGVLTLSKHGHTRNLHAICSRHEGLSQRGAAVCALPPDCTIDYSTGKRTYRSLLSCSFQVSTTHSALLCADYYEDPSTGLICACYGKFPAGGFISQGAASPQSCSRRVACLGT